MYTLGVLMWKHVRVRLRRYIHTPIELVCPVLVYLLLFSLKNEILPKHKSTHSDFQISEMEEFKLASTMSPNLVFYTPVSKFTDELMEDVGQQLDLQKLTKFPGKHFMRGYYGLDNEASLGTFIKDMYPETAVVVFQNMESTMPEQLNYTIRIKDSFVTNSFEAADSMIRPHKNFGTIYEPFMKLQWAIDDGFMRIQTGAGFNKTVLMQEFPFAQSAMNDSASLVCSLIITMGVLSLMLPFIFLMSRLVEERSTGIQELIKMCGVSPNMLALSHFLNAAPSGVVYAVGSTLLLTVTSRPLVPHTSRELILLAFALHYVSIMALAFACSYIVKKSNLITTLAVTLYVVTMAPALQWASHIRGGWLPLGAMLPHIPFIWFWREVQAMEAQGKGLSWSSLWSAHSSQSWCASAGFCAALVQALWWAVVASYLSYVRPGAHGTARPWNYFLKKKSSDDKKLESEPELERPIVRDPQYFEPIPRGADVGLHINNVSKIFGKERALSNVSLEVVRGEITVLLGHNGAGKTTLMSIITGMLSPSSGSVSIVGAGGARRQIGLCPQHNLFFPDLTVLEHVIFFSMLKGVPYTTALEDGLALLAQLGLSDKQACMSGGLSGGMKRRLQLACALGGGANVLVLDEPTSGLDVETRRELWDLLLSLRGSRTVLLTTHFMEEADALGDRVAALHIGRLRCHATPLFLKKNIGSGYRLTLTTLGAPRTSVISAVTERVPGVKLRETHANSLLFSLPASETNQFPSLFKHLESHRSPLGIETIGVSMPTLEEVFLKLCSNTNTSLEGDEVDGLPEGQVTYQRYTGFRLLMVHMSYLMKRQVQYLISIKWSFLLLQLILPIGWIFLISYLMNNLAIDDDENFAPKVPLTLDLYDKMGNPRVFYDAHDDVMRASVQRYKDVEFQASRDIRNAVLRVNQIDLTEYQKYLVGLEINDTHAKVWFNTAIRHTAPVGLALLAEALAVLPGPSPHISTYNHPYAYDIPIGTHKYIEPKGIANIATWVFFVSLCILTTVSNAVYLPVQERCAGVRRSLRMCGAGVVRSWAATALTHLLLYTTILVAPTALAAYIFEKDHTFDQHGFIGTLVLTLVLGTCAWLGVVYIVSQHCNRRAASVLLVVLSIGFGIVTPALQLGYDVLEIKPSFAGAMLWAAQHLATPHTVTLALMRAGNVASLNAYCNLNRAACPNLLSLPGLDVQTCCSSQGPPLGYLSGEGRAVGPLLLVLIGQACLYMAIVVITEWGVFGVACERVWSRVSRVSAAPAAAAPLVRAERTYVEKAIQLPPEQIPDAMLVHEVHKTYRSLTLSRSLVKSFHAVKGVSFSIKKGECFGLLGVNGAGKSTMFKMIVAETSATSGQIFANGTHLKNPSGTYLSKLGYCPQFSGLDEFLSGEENLTLLLALRGLPPNAAALEARAWLRLVGLESLGSRPASAYSGGSVRRLCCAAALAGGSPLALLDEPTAGVDVAARRRLWAALQRQRTKGALVISSHSLDEMEALCDRIAILCGGTVMALGEPAQLRAAVAGHRLQLKLAAPKPDTHAHEQMESLKADLRQKVDCTLKDEHKTMLHYHINETMPYSQLFQMLEELKSRYPSLVEDYSVTETSLEEVFLSYAQKASQTVDV